MKNIKLLDVVAAVLVLSAFTIAESASWKIAEDYSIKFTSKNPSGGFSKMDGVIIFNEDDLPGSSFDVKVSKHR